MSWGSSPNPAALLATCVLTESHDEWQAADRRYLPDVSMMRLDPTPTSDAVEISRGAERELDQTANPAA